MKLTPPGRGILMFNVESAGELDLIESVPLLSTRWARFHPRQSDVERTRIRTFPPGR